MNIINKCKYVFIKYWNSSLYKCNINRPLKGKSKSLYMGAIPIAENGVMVSVSQAFAIQQMISWNQM